MFEKESLEADFMLVKPCEKKPNKIVHLTKEINKTKNLKPQDPSEEKFYLSDILGISQQL